MKRTRAMAAMMTGVVLAGCGFATYENRLENTLKEMKDEQKLKAYTDDPAQGKFKELNVFLRAPKPSAEDNLQLTQAPGMFDHGATFTITPSAATSKDGEAGAALPPMKMHVLVRQKAKKAAPKKGEAPPPADAAAPVNRGDFVSDVRAVLAADFGGDVADKSPTNVTVGKTSFKHFKFTANSGDSILAYLADANKGELQSALIFDIPTAIQANPVVTKGKEYCLQSFAIGQKARNTFNGKAPQGGGAAGDAPGPAF